MKEFKKVTGITLALLLAFVLVLSGCSNNNGAGNTPAEKGTNGTKEGAQGEAEGKLKPYEIVMVYPDNTQNDLSTVQEAMNDYMKETYPEMNVTVKLNPVDWGAWADKTNLMMASGEKFDLLFTANWMGFDQQVNKGALLPLDELLAKHGPDIEAVEKDYHGAAMRGGKLYGIHTHQELGGLQGIAFRKDLVEKYKFDLSVFKDGDISKVEPMLETIKKNEPGVTPTVGVSFALSAYFGTGDMDMIIDPVGLYLKSDNSEDQFKVVSMYDTPRYLELAKLNRKWFKAGYLNQDATTPGLDYWTKIKSGKAFSAVGTDVEIVADANVGSVAPMPGRSAAIGVELIQVPLNIDGLRTGKMAATMQAISKTSEDPDRAMMFLNLFFKDKELLTLFNYGVEGKHYVLKDGQVALPEGQKADTVGFYHDNMWQIGNQMLNYTRVGEDIKKYENYEKFNELTAQKPSAMLGFVFDSEPVKNELVAIANVRKTFDPGLLSGQLEPETQLPKLQDKLKAAGIDKVVAEAQKQLDAWRAANGK
ncbi:ABC transporter substrate-binding protein [Paenibacillus swuensis]|uniref:ABC transporter substrate-binding protein n=1 Tax=Paenibacillus swuensis TaxID=1178515 RepID=A0A172THZ5_9BACL|nr:ABC transporter substrate-binding protein [Paenibacillus swuensis]ANE46403.1 ABC transporter substrate-binding protein [Paenibacillus swuensis]